MYKPKIECLPGGVLEPRKGPGYWVTEIPMPGERVMDRDGTVYTVRNPEVQWVEVDDRSHRLIKVLRLKVLRPYDPDAERLRVATKAVGLARASRFGASNTEIARAVLDALKGVDDG